MVASATALNPIIGVYLAKTGKYKLIFIISACALILTCFSYYFVLTPTTPVWVAMLSNLPRFINNCTFMAPILAYLSHILPEDKRGMGLGIAAFLQTLMGSVFTAVFGAVVNAYNGNLAVAFKTIMIITFVIAVARLVFAIALKDHKVVYDEIAALENNK
jgi:MFS family permease